MENREKLFAKEAYLVHNVLFPPNIKFSCPQAVFVLKGVETSVASGCLSETASKNADVPNFFSTSLDTAVVPAARF